jgi:hypothetical protein
MEPREPSDLDAQARHDVPDCPGPPEPAGARVCAGCGGPLDLRRAHVVVDGKAIRTFCSTDCRGTTGPLAILPPKRGRVMSRLVRLGLGVPILGLTSVHDAPPPAPPAPLAVVAAAPVPVEVVPTEGPEWPPSEQDWMREIAADAWLHPLDGPNRRMPVSDSRVFGAERPGDRPGECESGHCGVDLSGPWGEPVHAAHAGVVERVQRGANEDHGGQYVRLAHRDGTIITQYFHLAAIPRRLVPGTQVRVGEVIGLLGDTGVKHSDAHLHFTISVRPSSTTQERYIDPEPLIALWPLRIPIEASAGMIAPQAEPGIPRGANRGHHAHAHTQAMVSPAPAAAED